MTPPKLGVLGQAKPAAGTAVTLYTCPGDRRAVCSTLAIAETSGTLALIRVHVGIAGAAPDATNALFYDTELDLSLHYGVTEGITLGAGDKLYVRSDTGAVTFTMFGEETDIPS